MLSSPLSPTRINAVIYCTLILQKDEKFLLYAPNIAGAEGRVDFIRSTVHEGESLREAVQRIGREKSGRELEPKELLGVTYLPLQGGGINIFFDIGVDSIKETDQSWVKPEEVADLTWKTAEELEEMVKDPEDSGRYFFSPSSFSVAKRILKGESYPLDLLYSPSLD